MSRIRPCHVSVIAMVAMWLGGSQPATAQDALRAPPASDAPVEVSVGFRLLDIVEVNDRDQTFEFEGRLTLRWEDPRQRFDPAQVGTDERVFQGDYQITELFAAWRPLLVLENDSGYFEQQGVVLRISPDGTLTYIEEFQAVAEVDANLRHLPFDRRVFEIVFDVLGFGADRVRLTPSLAESAVADVGFNQWQLEEVRAETAIAEAELAGTVEGGVSRVRFLYPSQRSPWYLLRVIVFPLATLVALSWTVFWMSSSSLGDRLDISFIGILTVVAFQIVVADLFPRITYFTTLDAFLYVNYLTLVGTVFVNLRVDALDRRGEEERGDRLDYTCRWLFPLGYVSALAGLVAFFSFRF